MVLVEDVPEVELGMIKMIIGEASITNEMFHNFGSPGQRKIYVMKYMDIYLDYVYESRALYRMDDGSGYIGIIFSGDERLLPRLKMTYRMLRSIPLKKLRALRHFEKQVSDGRGEYGRKPHMDVLLICVDPACQERQVTEGLVDFAREKAQEKQVPVLFNTDTESYAQMYQHLGCSLYHTMTADNRVTRYHLVWNPDTEYTESEI